MGGNFYVHRNKIIYLGLPETSIYIDGKKNQEVFYLGNKISTGTYWQIYLWKDKPLAYFYGYETNGIIQDAAAVSTSPTVYGNQANAGDILFVTQNEDGYIDDNDHTIIGDQNP